MLDPALERSVKKCAPTLDKSCAMFFLYMLQVCRDIISVSTAAHSIN
jgi:hypothetical protein